MSTSYGPGIITDALEVHLDAANTKSYPLDGSTWYDLSGSSYDSSLYGGSSYDSSYKGNIEFNGTDGYTNVPDLGITGPATIDFWFYANILTNGMRPLSNIDDTKGTSGTMGLQFTSSTIQVWAGAWHTLSDTILDSTWYNFVMVFDNLGSSAILTPYLNARATNYPSTQTFNLWKMGIGSRYVFNGGVFGSFFNGKVSNFKLYSKDLSEAEILQNYNALKSRFVL